jgi:SOS response regulatory protein OraA/RecX
MCDVAERLEKMGMEKRKIEGIHKEKVRVYKKLLEKGFSEQEVQEIAELPEPLGV